MEENNEKKIAGNYAIVFAGGGAKGAWQIGVWKALQKKFEKPATAVAGTSVGALNAALYALSPTDTTHAEEIWKEAIKNKPIITPQLPEKFINLATAVESASSFLADLLIQCKKLTFYSNKNLRSVIREGISGRKFSVPVYVCAYDQKNKIPHYEPIQVIKDEERRCNWLLASTAIPYVFKGIDIDNTLYTDGGFGWDHALRVGIKSLIGMRNVPLEPIKKHGNIKNVFILTLSQNEETYWQESDTDFQIIPIMPSRNLGNALDFSEKHINEIMRWGEEDGEAWLNSNAKLIENSARLYQIHKKGKEIFEFTAKFENIKKIREKLMVEYKNEFKDALQEYKKNPTQENKEILNNCSLLNFSDDSLAEMEDRIYLDVFGDNNTLSDITKILEEDDNLEQEYAYCVANSKRLISLAESSGKHELSQHIMDILSYAKNKKIASELPNEKKETLKSIINQFKSIQGILCVYEQKFASNDLKWLKKDIQDLAQKIDQSVKWARNALPTDAPLPSFLKPSRCSNFVGRQHELDFLDSTVHDNPDKAIVLFGFSGNGKKQLALRYAELHQNEFPGGCFVIDAAGKKSFAEVLRNLLDRIEICEYWNLRRDDITDSEEIRTELVVNKLKDDIRKKLLIISHIDNALFLTTEEFDLFSASNITLIATAGQSVFLPDSSKGVIQIEVKRLSSDEGVALLKNRCSSMDDDQIVKRIVEDCGGNPWALNLIGARYLEVVSSYGEYAEDDLLAQEYASGEIKKDVFDEFCLKMVKPSYELLSPEEKTFLIYASLLSYGKICGKWLAGIFGKQWLKIVNGLIRRSLIDDISTTEEKKNRTYWFEMLGNTRNAIWRIVDGNEIRDCAEKLCKHIAECEMKNHTFSWDETLTLAKCFCEWAGDSWKSWNQKILPLIFSLDMHDDLGDYLSEYKMLDLRLKVCDAAEHIIHSMEDCELKWKNQASCCIYRGHINLDCNLDEQALACYQKSYEIRNRVFHEANETFLPREYQATVYGRMGNLQEAEKIFIECEKKFLLSAESATIKDSRTASETLARLYKRWADAQFENGKTMEAEINYKKAIDYAGKGFQTEKDVPGGVASILLGRFNRALGVFYKKEGRVEEAIHFLKESNSVLQSLCSKEIHADVKENLIDLQELA